MKTAAIYARVSTADQVKGTSLDGQVALCQDYAKEAGYSVIKVVQEDASGARLDRPKLGELRNMAERREIEALIVFDPDRLSRSMAHTMMLMDEFERNKAGVLFVNAPREDTPEGSMLFGMKALFAEYERSKIMERTRRGKERRIREGRVMISCSSPYGYEYIPVEHRLQMLESEAAWAVKMFEWLVYEGCSLRQIAQRLQENAVPTKAGAKAWHPGVIRQILSNELYAGTWHYGKHAGIEPKSPRGGKRSKTTKSSRERRPRSEWLSVAVPALIPQELYDAVHAQLERNQAMSPRHTKNQYLFRGLLTCSRCGYKMCGYTQTANRNRSYQCPGRTLRHVYSALEQRCTQPNVPLDRLETIVWDEVVRQLSDEKVLRGKLEELEAQRRSGRKDDETELEVLINLELALKQDAAKLLDYAMSNIIDRATLEERMAIVREKQAGIARSKAEVTARLTQWEQGPGSEEAIQRLCELAKRGLPHCSFEERRAFLEGMDVKLTMDGDKVTVTGLITDSTLTIAGRHAPPDCADSDILRNRHLGGDFSLPY
jgi:site-specific DNA recombinase